MDKDTLPRFNPLWLYRFFFFYDRQPIRGWLLAVLVIVGYAVVLHLSAWEQGTLPKGQLNGYLATVGAVLMMAPAMLIYFTRRAHAALLDFYANSSKSKAYIEKIAADFNSLPGWLAAWLVPLGTLWGYANYVFFIRLSIPLADTLPQFSLLTWCAIHIGGLLLLVRTVRQALIAQRLYHEIKVDLFNPLPIYALSRYGSLLSIVFILLTYSYGLLAFAEFFTSPIGFFYQGLSIALALLIFFIPLMGINQRMRRAKEHILAQLGKDIEQVYLQVHKAVGDNSFTTLGRMQGGVMTLKNELELIQRIPTWPWQPETLRNLLAPMLIPVIVYLVQRFLGNMLGF